MKRAKTSGRGALYIPLSKVAESLNLKPHILYYWEKKFPELKPYKISQRKFYKEEQIELLKKIKHLTEQGYTLDAAKKLIKSHKNLVFSKEKVSTQKKKGKKDLSEVLKEVLKELKEIYKAL